MGKKLGQHFLKSKDALRQIITAADLNMDDTVLEVGPGKGILTEELLQNAGKVIAVERDPKLYEELGYRFVEEIKAERMDLIEGDILDPRVVDMLQTTDYKIVANLPYYITGEFLRKFLTSNTPPSKMVLLVQKEVADRIVNQKKESLLSLSVKTYGQPKYIGKVAARYFSPPPRVDSAIISINKISKEFFEDNKVNEEHFFDLLRFCFQRKRKRVLGSIAEYSDRDTAKGIAEKCQIPQGARPEDLTLEQWLCAVKF